MRKNLLSVFALTVASAVCGQSLDAFKGMSMRHLGPGAMSGRVTDIDVLLSDTRVIYAATASGGLWRTENGGTTWTPIFDDQPTQCIGSVAVRQDNPDVIWVGTGEGNPRNSQNSGIGMFKSTDGGKSWQRAGLEQTKTIHRIIIHRDNPEVVLAGTLGSAWGPNPDRGVYRTEDGGKTWNKTLYVNDLTGCADLVADPSNPDKLIAAMWEYKREPWFFNSGGKGSGLYVSFDGGKTWTQRTHKDGLPEGPLGRIGLAIAPGNPKVVYALIESKELALYKSTDGGFKWKKVGTENVGNRPFYYADIYVSPDNENEIWSLWSAISKSIDGGKTFENVVGYWDIHPDHHAFWINPRDSKHLINGNDGGLNISRDGGKTWEYMTHLPLGQFYHIDADNEIPYRIYGGMQDNGSWVGPGSTWESGGIRNEYWREIHFGDGFDVAPHPADSDIAYGMSQGGNVYCINISTGEKKYIRPVHPDGNKLRFNWNAAVATDPHRADGVFFGSQHLHYSPDRGNSWQILSPDLTTNNPEKLKQAESGGLTRDVTTAENHCTILCIAPSPHSPDVIWVGTDDGNLQLTRDRGKSWINLTPALKGMPKNAWIPQIRLSPYRDGEAFVVVNNYRQNDWRPFLFHTKDFGKTWVNLVTEKSVEGFCHTIIQDPVVEKLLFLGTEQGLYVSFDYGKTWQRYTHDYPSVPTVDLVIQARESDLIIGTFGRGAYILDNIQPLREAANRSGRMPESGLVLFSSPASYMVDYQRPPGARFTANHTWEARNKPGGQLIHWHIPAAEIRKLKDVKEDGEKEVHVRIFNAGGDTLRYFTAKADSGITRIHWGFDTNGVRWPSWGERKADEKPAGGGPRVLPGTYRAEVTFRGEKHSANLRVYPDPRKSQSANAQEMNALRMEFNEIVGRADTGFERLKSAKKVIATVRGLNDKSDEESRKALSAKTDSLSKEISRLQELFMVPQDTKGYVDSSDKLNSILGQASGYLWGDMMAPGKNTTDAVEQARKRTDEVLAEIEAMFNGPWKDWESAVRTTDFDLFRGFGGK
jgi:photosystem II stability/assembly factor-like uncharacterized protein